MTSGPPSTRVGLERAILVGIATPDTRERLDASMAELALLADAAGANVVGELRQERARPDPATFIGPGKVETLAAICAAQDVDVVIVDHELTPSQLRQLDDRVGCRVIDRTQLILDIFARRAKTREGKLQVELAQLEYLLPRLVGSRASLSRLGGGIGTRGPGETKLEVDRRRVRTRIQALRAEIAVVRQRRHQLRERRQKRDTPTVALVGYTNAGKTTLFNRLTGGDAVASDALFVTLDPLVRRVRLPDAREMLVSDTVGFIERLPHALVAAFAATLEEVVDADLVLHVIDASNPAFRGQVTAVEGVLAELGAVDVPSIKVFNKVDRLTPEHADRLAQTEPTAVLLSARLGTGLDRLIERITTAVALDPERVLVTIPDEAPDAQARIAALYRSGQVVRHERADGQTLIEAEVPKRLVGRVVPS